MMSEDDFIKLREHLKLIQPYFDDFVDDYKYEYANPKSLGRYPRLRINKNDNYHKWIELCMCLDDDGKRYEKFFEKIPYELSAGVYVKKNDLLKQQYRYQISTSIYDRKPFNQVSGSIVDDFKKCKAWLDGWDKESIMKEGVRVKLGGRQEPKLSNWIKNLKRIYNDF